MEQNKTDATQEQPVSQRGRDLIRELSIAEIEIYWLGAFAEEDPMAKLLRDGMCAAARTMGICEDAMQEQIALIEREREIAMTTTEENRLESTLPDGTLLQAKSRREIDDVLEALHEAHGLCREPRDAAALDRIIRLLPMFWGEVEWSEKAVRAILEEAAA